MNVFIKFEVFHKNRYNHIMFDKNNTLSSYFFTRSFHKALNPLASIMDLTPEEANDITSKFTQNLSDQGDYFSHRQKVERWLHEQAIKIGTRIDNHHPLYFFLTREMVSDQHDNPDMRYMSVKASEIDLATCTFTIGDSFCHHKHIETNGKESYGMPYNPYFGQVIGSKNQDAIINGLDILTQQGSGYVEVQVWGRPQITPHPLNNTV